LRKLFPFALRRAQTITGGYAADRPADSIGMGVLCSFAPRRRLSPKTNVAPLLNRSESSGLATPRPPYVPHVRVDHRRFDAGVPQKLLDCANIITVFQQMGGEAVPERVARRAFCNPRPTHRRGDRPRDRSFVRAMPTAGAAIERIPALSAPSPNGFAESIPHEPAKRQRQSARSTRGFLRLPAGMPPRRAR
jgi:hypothetical protein